MSEQYYEDQYEEAPAKAPRKKAQPSILLKIPASKIQKLYADAMNPQPQAPKKPRTKQSVPISNVALSTQMKQTKKAPRKQAPAQAPIEQYMVPTPAPPKKGARKPPAKNAGPPVQRPRQAPQPQPTPGYGSDLFNKFFEAKQRASQMGYPVPSIMDQ